MITMPQLFYFITKKQVQINMKNVSGAKPHFNILFSFFLSVWARGLDGEFE